jgi:exodeoxyribonuclease V gamma subunit
MVRLVYSNRVEELLVELTSRVRAQQLEDGPLAPVSIVVPSAAVEAYVRVGIARECGVAANLDVASLTSFASDVVAAALGARVADAAAIEAMMLSLLLDEAWLATADAAPLREYLYAAGAGADSVDLRRVQLASHVGRIFEEYTYSRAEMLSAWSRRDAHRAPGKAWPSRGAGDSDGGETSTGQGETERWQRAAWLAMFGDGGLTSRRVAATGGAVVPLHDAVAALPGVSLTLTGIHVFAFAHMGPTFHDLFVRLAEQGSVFFYALSPCEGFWEDVGAGDPELLRLWSRPGRDQVRALNESAGFDHDDRFVDALAAGGPSLLHRIQHDLMRRQAATCDEAPDDSLVILENASARRELEAVASEIWELCETRDDLRFDEIAVLIPEATAGEYGAQLAAVFREAHDIPFQSLGVGVIGPSRVDEVVDLLIALPLGRFTRQDLLRVVVHPCVAASVRRAAGGDVHAWVAWCDSLGIVHGADRTDHRETYIERDILNWDQGLRRLALGTLMAGEASGDARTFRMGEEAYIPLEVAPAEISDATGFGKLARSLIADARFAAHASLTLREWADFIASMVEVYVAPVDAAEEENLASCLRFIEAVGRMDLGGQRVGYRVACELARARLARAPGGRGGHGVVVSTLHALRPLPFRVVFACGMGEGSFPSPDVDDPLDLRWERRRPGDVSARERDRYAFLEMLLATRDRLVLSFVSRDPVTGDPLAPSSAVQELTRVIARNYGVPTDAWRRSHPLRRWDLAYFPWLAAGTASDGRSIFGTMHLPEARAEALTLAVRRMAESRGDRPGLDDVQRRALTDSAWAALARHLELPAIPEVAPAPEARLTIPLHAILKFLEFPLQGWARFRLGLDDAEDDDVMVREDEPFETVARERTVLLRRIFFEALSTGAPLAAAYDAEIERRALRGEGPSGVFARGERANHLRALETWGSVLEAQSVPLDRIEQQRFGRAGEHAKADAVHPALSLDLDIVDGGGVTRVLRVEITGRTMPLGALGTTSLALLARPNEDAGEWARADRARMALRGFIDHVVLAASGTAAERAHDALVVIATDEAPCVERRRFASIPRERALGWLRTIVRDLLSGTHAYFLPCEAVFAQAASETAGRLAEWIEKARARIGDEDGPKAVRSTYGPVPRVRDYPAPADAEAIVARRFGPLLETWSEVKS